VLGSIIDPMADKMLMTTLVISLTYQGLVPRKFMDTVRILTDSPSCGPHLWEGFRSFDVGHLPRVHFAPTSCKLKPLPRSSQDSEH
jgi:hypothetical protein